MFIRKNSWQYWLTAVVLAFTVTKLYKAKNIESKDEDLKVITKSEVKEILEVNTEDLTKTIGEVIKSINQNKEGQPIPENVAHDNISITQYTFFENQKRIGLCSNTYNFHVKALDERGETVFVKNNLPLSSLKQDADLYKELNKAFTLGFVGMKLDLFAQNGPKLEKLINKTNSIKQGEGMLLKITLSDIVGKVNFDPKKVKTFQVFNQEKLKKRPDFYSFCGDTIHAQYSLFTLEGDFIKKEERDLVLGKGTGVADEILEYLTLNSKDGIIDAIIPSISLKKNVIIKGKIIKYQREEVKQQKIQKENV